MTVEPKPQKYAIVMWILLGLFCLRVSGQLLITIVDIPFLPPLEKWDSGLLPYPLLFTIQIAVIMLMTKITLDFTFGTGLFVSSRFNFYKARILGYIYLGVMILRYVIRMIQFPDERWFGGVIPIMFHWVLASFVILFGLYHWHKQKFNSAEILHETT